MYAVLAVVTVRGVHECMDLHVSCLYTDILHILYTSDARLIVTMHTQSWTVTVTATRPGSSVRVE